MRIMAGQLKGRRLVAPKGSAVRPTSDSLRETLFNVLGPTLDGARVLDGFAGTGAVGLEALSRGAAHVTFVERDRHALETLAGNIRHCGVEQACTVVRDDFITGRWMGRLAAPAVFELVWLDPPYEVADLDAVTAKTAGLVASGGRMVLEHSRRRDSPVSAGGIARVRNLVAGDSALSFYT